MPAITSSTSFVLPRGSSVIFELGGTGTATVDPTGISNAYRIGLQEAFLGPYDRNVTILVTVEGGTINYRIDADGDLSDQSPALVALGTKMASKLLLPAIPRVTMSSPPTVTMESAHGISGGVLVPFTPNASSPWISTAGGASFTVLNSIYWTAGQTNPGTSIRNPCSIVFGFSGVACSVQLTSAPGHSYRISVSENGAPFQLVTDWVTAAGPGGGAIRHLKMVFAAAADRKIKVDSTFADIAGVIVGPTDSIWAAPVAGPRALFVGDSFMGGAGVGPVGYNGLSSWIWTYAMEMGWEHVTNAGVGGQMSTNALARVTANMAASQWDYVHIGFGKNDNPTNSAAVYADAVAALCSVVKRAQPQCVLVVDGPNFPGAPVNRTADPTWGPYQTALFSAVDGLADYKLDTINSAIFTGTGRAGATTGSGNGDLYIQSDAAHPNQAGSDYKGRRKAAQFRALLQGMA